MGKRLPDVDVLSTPSDSALLYADLNNHDYQITLGALHAQERARLNSLEGAQYYEFDNSSLLTTQVDALPVESTYRGMINSYGYQSETGMPENASFYVDVFNSDSTSYRYVKVMVVGDGTEYINTKSNGSWSGWTKLPTRAEITSINSSLTNTFISMAAGSNAVTITQDNSYRYGNIVFVSVRFTVSTTIAIYGYVLQLPSSLRVPTDAYFPLTSGSFNVLASKGLYLDANSYTIRASSQIDAGTYTCYVPLLVRNA